MLNSISQSARLKIRLRWLDDGNDEMKSKLVTNDSALDLIHREENEV